MVEIKMAFLNNRVKVRHRVIKLTSHDDKLQLVEWSGSKAVEVIGTWPTSEIAKAIEGFNSAIEDVMGDGFMLMAVE